MQVNKAECAGSNWELKLYCISDIMVYSNKGTNIPTNCTLQHFVVDKSYASFFIDFFKGCNTFSQHEWTNFHNIANKSLSNMQIYKFTSSHPPQQAMLSRMNDVKKDVEEHT